MSAKPFDSPEAARAAFALGSVSFRCLVCGKVHESFAFPDWVRCLDVLKGRAKLELCQPGMHADALPWCPVLTGRPPFWLRQAAQEKWRRLASEASRLYALSDVRAPLREFELPSYMLAVAPSVFRGYTETWIEAAREKVRGEAMEKKRQLWRRYAALLAHLSRLVIPREFPEIVERCRGEDRDVLRSVSFVWPGDSPAEGKAGAEFFWSSDSVLECLLSSLCWKESRPERGIHFLNWLAWLLAGTVTANARERASACFLSGTLRELEIRRGAWVRAFVEVRLLWERDPLCWPVSSGFVALCWPVGARVPSLGPLEDRCA